jgi:hypothetical protein
MITSPLIPQEKTFARRVQYERPFKEIVCPVRML